jgi:sporulation protein YlmC with PRC-barrel domain
LQQNRTFSKLAILTTQTNHAERFFLREEDIHVMRIPLFVAAIIFAIAATVVPSLAQTSTASSAPVAGGSLLGVSVSELNFVAVGYRASKILGAPVYNDSKKRVGTVKDFVVTPKAYVSYIIVAVGGFLGLGQKDVAIPAKQFRGLSGKVILPGATKQALEALPAFHFSR